MIRVILFDIDGTLIRTGGAGVRAFARTFASEFGEPDLARRLNFAGRTDTSLVREAFSLAGIPPAQENFKRFFDAYLPHLEQLLRECAGQTCPGVGDLIRDLRQRSGTPLLGLLTGNIQFGARLKLTRYELWEHFAFGAYGDDHEDRNQLARIAQERAADLLGRPCAGAEILVIGDTPRDVECARFIGAKVLAVATGGSTVEQLRCCEPDWLVEDLQKFLVDEICPMNPSFSG